MRFLGLVVRDGFRVRLVRIVVQLSGKVIRDVPVSLIIPQPTFKIRTALGAVNRDGHTGRQQLYIAALEVGYLVLAPLKPHEVPDAVGRRHRLARLYVDRRIIKLRLIFHGRLAQVVVCGIQSHAVERLAQAWVVVVGTLEVPVVRVRGEFPEHTLTGQCSAFCVGVYHCVRIVIARHERLI